ncbi:TetR/AcrR family transcriptional regulator [Sphingomonas daechungensis]|uniref:TetR/AcrR family transcriptional regulator n=1 Tax=Sphingomonas daechungensis TaxID=1176646 RepID=UPI00378391DE
MDSSRTGDHRVRVAAERRDRMRSKLMEAALVVFSSPDAEPKGIEHVIRHAGVSRGSFYNYFESVEELLKAVAVQVSDDLMDAVAPVVEARAGAAERVSAGIRSWIALIEANQFLAAFFRRAGLYVFEQNTRLREDLPRDLVAGMASGQFTIAEVELGFVLVAGTVLAAINTLALGLPPPDYGKKLSQRILMSLGVESHEAERISQMAIPKAQFPKDSPVSRAAG